jgi:hypothetical protein
MKTRKVLIHENFWYRAAKASNGIQLSCFNAASDCYRKLTCNPLFPGLSEHEMATEFTAKHSYELRSVRTWTD